MKVENMLSPIGNRVANQFIITDATFRIDNSSALSTGTVFQSYRLNIVFHVTTGPMYLDSKYWKYSKTTSKYRNIFLGESTKETQDKIDSGEYILVNLND